MCMGVYGVRVYILYVCVCMCSVCDYVYLMHSTQPAPVPEPSLKASAAHQLGQAPVFQPRVVTQEVSVT